MDKMKNFFSPGHSKDDELMYGTGSPSSNKGKVAGEGSHFGSSHSDEPASSPTSPDLQNKSTPEKSEIPHTTATDQAPPANASKVAGEGSHFPSSEKEETYYSTEHPPQETTDPSKPLSAGTASGTVSSPDKKIQSTISRLDNPATEDASVASIKSGVPGHQSHEIPTSTTSPTTSPEKDDSRRSSDRGAGIGVAGGATGGAAVAAASKAWKPGTSDGSQPAESRVGTGMPGSFPGDDENPYRTAHIDPRVDSKPSSPALSAAKSSTQATRPSTSTEAVRRSSPNPSAQKEKDESHKGRDAGIGAAALGALGLGGYEAKKHHEEKAEAPPATDKQPSQPTTADARAPSSKTSNAPKPTEKYVKPESEKSPVTTDKRQTAKPSDTDRDHHYGRDTGIIGAAAAAVGLGSREAKDEGEQNHSDVGKQGPESLGTDVTRPTQASKPIDVADETRVDMAGPGGLDDQRYDPSGTSKQHITPVGTSDRPQRDPAPQSTTSAQPDSGRDEHHYGRDAGLAAGAGAAGVGAYEAKKRPDNQTHRSARPDSGEKLSNDRPLSAGAPPDQMSLYQHNRDNSKSTLDDANAALLRRNVDAEKNAPKPIPEGAERRSQTQAPAKSRTKPSNYPEQTIRQDKPAAKQEDKEDDHTARNIALGAAGLGAGAYGAEKLSKRSEPDQRVIDSQSPGSQTDNWPLKDNSATSGTQAPVSRPVEDRKLHEEVQAPDKDDRTARNAALAGAAGVGAGAYAGHEYSQHEAEKFEKERLKQQKAHEKEIAKEQAQQQKDHDKATAKEAKTLEKEAAKEEKHAEKEAAKAEKKHEKEIAAQEKEHEKLEKAHEKELAAQEKEREKIEKAREREALEAEKRRSKEGGVVAGDAFEEKEAPNSPSNKSVSSQGDEKKRHGLRRVLHKIAHPGEKEEEEDHHAPDSPSSGHHHDGRHKLHKDPPKGRYSGDDQTPSYADYAVKENQHQGAQTIKGGYTAPDASVDPTKYPPGHAEEASPLMDKEGHFLSQRFGDHSMEDRVHQGGTSTLHPKGS